MAHASLAIFQGLGLPELLVIGVVLLLLFGTRLPSVMRSIGKGISEFRKGMEGVEDALTREPDEPRKLSTGEGDGASADGKPAGEADVGPKDLAG